MINILLVDDQALLCEVLKTWLDVEQGLQVVGVAHNGQEAIEKVEKLQPDIVLMDIDMPQMDGLNATKIISQRFPHVKVIFLSGYDDDTYLGKSLRAGAKGYLLKNTTAEELVLKIRSVYNNINLMDSDNEEQLLDSIKNQLEGLLNNYRQQFETEIAEYRNSFTDSYLMAELEEKFNQRLQEIEQKFVANQASKISKIEKQNQSSWESIRKEIISVNGQFNQANRNLTSQFNQQLDGLRQDLDNRLSSALDDWSRQRAALQEWAVQRDEMRPSMEEYELKNRQELMSVVNPIKASFRDVDKQLKTIRNWLIGSSVLTVVALTVSSYLLFSQVKSNNSFLPPNQDVVSK
ncbi:LuxR family two component transcriptional regulator [Chondrocystis sp. NIES-4102]|nr:LuxR family two component transcriptional regulator [Chondrocystis sp. NIES-4102]